MSSQGRCCEAETVKETFHFWTSRVIKSTNKPHMLAENQAGHRPLSAAAVRFPSIIDESVPLSPSNLPSLFFLSAVTAPPNTFNAGVSFCLPSPFVMQEVF